MICEYLVIQYEFVILGAAKDLMVPSKSAYSGFHQS